MHFGAPPGTARKRVIEDVRRGRRSALLLPVGEHGEDGELAALREDAVNALVAGIFARVVAREDGLASRWDRYFRALCINTKPIRGDADGLQVSLRAGPPRTLRVYFHIEQTFDSMEDRCHAMAAAGTRLPFALLSEVKLRPGEEHILDTVPYLFVVCSKNLWCLSGAYRSSSKCGVWVTSYVHDGESSSKAANLWHSWIGAYGGGGKGPALDWWDLDTSSDSDDEDE